MEFIVIKHGDNPKAYVFSNPFEFSLEPGMNVVCDTIKGEQPGTVHGVFNTSDSDAIKGWCRTAKVYSPGELKPVLRVADAQVEEDYGDHHIDDLI